MNSEQKAHERIIKMLIAYDGSECADAALEHLKNAGLPKTAEVLVMSLADVFVPPPINEEIDNTNSPYSNAAVEAVCRREWPTGTEVRLLAVVDTVMAIAPDPSQPSILKWIEVDDENNWDEVRKIFQPSADKLRSAGLDAAVMIRRGSPTNELLEEAESWEADCIFLGPKGTRGIDRLLLGSVLSSLSARTLLGRSGEAEANLFTWNLATAISARIN